MLKKYLYHGCFALLGISLLLGMAFLQAEGLKTTPSDREASEDLMETSRIDETTPPEVAEATPAGAELQVAQLPAAVPVPEIQRVPVVKKTPVPSKAPTSAKRQPVAKTANPLAGVLGFEIYDSQGRAMTLRTYGVSPNDLRDAWTYYTQLSARNPKHVAVDAKLQNGSVTALSTKSFRQHVKNNTR